MMISWAYDQTGVDWIELADLYRIAPLGERSPKELEVVFTNSRFKCFAYEENILVGVGRALADGMDCSYICDVAIHPDYQGRGLGKKVVRKLIHFSTGHKKIIIYAKLGFKQMNTAMAIFADPERALAIGLINET